MIFEDWGIINYADAVQRQHECFEHVIHNKLAGIATIDVVNFCEHPSVITIGRHGKESNLLVDSACLKSHGIDYYHTDRGGDITFHGLGQQVVYPIIDLQHFGLGIKKYVNILEQCVIDLLSIYGISACRVSGASGVWLDSGTDRERKICAIGVRASHYITMHGIGLNVNTDLSYFSFINPCGFMDKGVTSMERELNHKIDMEDVKDNLRAIFTQKFS